MSISGLWPQVLDFFGAPLVLEPSPGRLSSDGGLVMMGHGSKRRGTGLHCFRGGMSDLHRNLHRNAGGHVTHL
jgi:hypothetical protein